MTTFQEARSFLLKHRTDYDAAVKGFRWPDPVPFNWALDWFDAELAGNSESKDRRCGSSMPSATKRQNCRSPRCLVVPIRPRIFSARRG
jgi:hypothetical protein